MKRQSNLLDDVSFTLTEVGPITFGNNGIERSLQQLHDLGASSVTLSWQFFTENSVAKDNRFSTLEEFTNAIDYAKSLGLEVSLKPQFFGEDWSWSAIFTPTNPIAWFKSYGDLLVSYASIAQRHGVTKFFLTNEGGFINTNPEYLPYWREIISQVRSVFDGAIGVNAVWDTSSGSGMHEEATRVTYGSLLDFIGLSVYNPLTSDETPSRWEIFQAWYKNKDGINLIDYIEKLNDQYKKPVEITEIAYAATDGATVDPTNLDLTGNINYQLQSDAYLAALAALIKGTGSGWSDRFEGIDIWGWYGNTDPVPLLAMGNLQGALFRKGGSAIQDNPIALAEIGDILSDSDLTLYGSSANEILMGSRGMDTVVYAQSFTHYSLLNEDGYALVRSPHSNSEFTFKFASTIKNSTTPKISISINDVVVLEPQLITSDWGSAFQSFQVNANSSSNYKIEINVTDCAYVDENNFSNLAIVDIDFNDTDVDLFDLEYENGDTLKGYAFSNNGTVSFEQEGLAENYLFNIERLQFTDTNLALDTDGIAGEAYRIYKAAFDRAPDVKGLGYWINDMDGGTSLTTVAAGFIASEEFQNRYGAAVSEVDFITLLYANVLDRTPDQSGLDYWINDMKNGLSRAAVLASFSESAENQRNVSDLIANGIGYTPFIS